MTLFSVHIQFSKCICNVLSEEVILLSCCVLGSMQGETLMHFKHVYLLPQENISRVVKCPSVANSKCLH